MQEILEGLLASDNCQIQLILPSDVSEIFPNLKKIIFEQNLK